MIKTPHALFAALMSALLLAGPSSAEPASTTAGTSVGTQDASDLETGSIEEISRRNKERRFEDCMDSWDKGTHMTKRQWRRTCLTSMKDFPSL
jgi:hypothetical protein